MKNKELMKLFKKMANAMTAKDRLMPLCLVTDKDGDLYYVYFNSETQKVVTKNIGKGKIERNWVY